jgi:hypothetical protein
MMRLEQHLIGMVHYAAITAECPACGSMLRRSIVDAFSGGQGYGFSG